MRWKANKIDKLVVAFKGWCIVPIACWAGLRTPRASPGQDRFHFGRAQMFAARCAKTCTRAIHTVEPQHCSTVEPQYVTCTTTRFDVSTIVVDSTTIFMGYVSLNDAIVMHYPIVIQTTTVYSRF